MNKHLLLQKSINSGSNQDFLLGLRIHQKIDNN